MPSFPQVSLREFVAWFTIRSIRKLAIKKLLKEFFCFKSNQARTRKASLPKQRKVLSQKDLMKQRGKDKIIKRAKQMHHLFENYFGGTAHNNVFIQQENFLKNKSASFDKLLFNSRCKKTPKRGILKRTQAESMEENMSPCFSTSRSHYRNQSKLTEHRDTQLLSFHASDININTQNNEHAGSEEGKLNLVEYASNIGLKKDEQVSPVRVGNISEQVKMKRKIRNQRHFIRCGCESSILQQNIKNTKQVLNESLNKRVMLYKMEDDWNSKNIDKANRSTLTGCDNALVFLQGNSNLIHNVSAHRKADCITFETPSVSLRNKNSCHLDSYHPDETPKPYFKKRKVQNNSSKINNGVQVSIKKREKGTQSNLDLLQKCNVSTQTDISHLQKTEIAVQCDISKVEFLTQVNIANEGGSQSDPEVLKKNLIISEDILIEPMKTICGTFKSDIPCAQTILSFNDAKTSSMETCDVQYTDPETIPNTEPIRSCNERLSDVVKSFFVGIRSQYEMFDPPVSSTVIDYENHEKTFGVPEFEFNTEKEPSIPVLSNCEIEELHSVSVGSPYNLKCSKWKNKGDVSDNFDRAQIKELTGEKTKDEQIVTGCIRKLDADIQAFIDPNKLKTNSLDGAKVIGQVDKNFIAALLEIADRRSSHLIVLFDQHAVDERINLEALFKVYQAEDGSFLSVKLEKPISIEVTDGYLMILEELSDTCSYFGLKVKFVKPFTVIVTDVPVCFIRIHEREATSYQKSSLNKIVEDLLMEIAELLIDARGATVSTPNTIINIISSEACHGAIKFNQELTVEEMKQMLKKLCHCQAPFQCAHGSFSVVSLINLNNKLIKASTNSKKLNFKRFKKTI